MNCPKCGTKDYYDAIMGPNCVNHKCQNYAGSKAALKDPLVSTHDNNWNGHIFPLRNYLMSKGKYVGCTYCNNPRVFFSSTSICLEEDCCSKTFSFYISCDNDVIFKQCVDYLKDFTSPTNFTWQAFLSNHRMIEIFKLDIKCDYNIIENLIKTNCYEEEIVRKLQ